MARGLKTMPDRTPSSGKPLLSDCSRLKTPTSSDPYPLKKTRDLPDLTECQACGSRTGNASGKNRIQVLYSEWRIVLLCPRCYHRVDSSQICSYCFKEAADECFSCGQCKRSLHKTCFLNYKSVPPWSYSVCGSESTVCIDCWVPKQISHKRGSLRRNRKAKNSNVSDVRDVRGPKLLENVVKDANCAMEKKVEAAVKAREMAVKKAVVAQPAVELASNALEECNDAELAFRLHWAMNSSPRISKNIILCEKNGLEPLIDSSRAFSHLKLTEIVPSETVYACRNKPNDMAYVQDGKKPPKLVYKRRKKHSESQEKSGAEIGMKEKEENCCSVLSKPNDMVYVQPGKKPPKLVYKRRKNLSEPQEKTGVEIGMKEREENCCSLLLKPNDMVYIQCGKKPPKLIYKRRKKHSESQEKSGAEIGMERVENCCSLLSKPNDMVYAQQVKKPPKLVYKRLKKHGESQEKLGVGIGMKEKEENCCSLLSNSSGVDNSMNPESKPYNYLDESIAFKDMWSNGKLVQYVFMYSRKKSNCNETPNGKPKFLYEGYNLESEATSPQLPESLMIPTSTPQFSGFPHPASAGASDLCEDHS